MKQILIIPIALLFIGCGEPIVSGNQTEDTIAQSLYSLTNNERTEKLTPAECLERVARCKVDDMIQYNYFDHERNGVIPSWDWVEKECGAFKKAGENLSMDSTSADNIHRALMNSEGHRRNIMDEDFTYMGFYCDQGKCAEIFASFPYELY
ncbi:MAG: CAP domain-containing protein [Syntrophobacteraceae bacterium]